MEYAQLNPALTVATQITTNGNVAWDADNFCSAEALVKDGKAAQFRVVELIATEAPAIDAKTQVVVRDGCEKVGNEWRYKWRVDALTAAQIAAKLASARVTLIKKMDADIDAIYRAVQGDRGPEYTRAEAEAIAFKQAGYTGTVPDSVASWANAKAWTATQATDDILATATGWRTAQSAMRATRLSCKEIARTANDLTAVTTQWEAFLVTIKTALGVV